MSLVADFHIATVIFSFGIIFFADKQAIAWMRGTQQTLDRKRLRSYHALTWSGLGLLIASGSILFWPRADYLLAQPLFLMKMLFVGILVANAILIGRLMDVAVAQPFSSLSKRELLPLFASGAFSMLGWVGATLAAIAVFS